MQDGDRGRRAAAAGEAGLDEGGVRGGHDDALRAGMLQFNRHLFLLPECVPRHV